MTEPRGNPTNPTTRHPRAHAPRRARREPPTPDGSAWVAIGEITSVFGISGEMKVRPLTDFPERFTAALTVYAGGDRRPYEITSARQHKGAVLLRLSGIDSIEAAEPLRGQTLSIPESAIAPLPPDQFYQHDLVGLRVEDISGASLGVITDVVGGAGGDLFVVRTPSGREVLLPAVKAFIKAIDIPGGVVRVEPIPGLFDEGTEEAH